ncbi:MAG: DNA topoisomerase I [Candidatus Thorarchaeota archaeon]|nr:DNA topoisomerase I [Candidatus Thorarchaeota archaeon]
MESLAHNGILVLEPPPAKDLRIKTREKEIVLSQLQEEMATAWVRKLGTPYVEDPVFAENFMTDFSKALGIEPVLKVEEIDFTEVIRVVEAERAVKENMSSEEKKAQREERKQLREDLKEKYGYATVDGERMELGNYQTEPSGIFMGRGQHPLRGRWKQGATKKDITLNIDPLAREDLEGEWKELIWAPDTMWIAKWTDELTGKVKYIWLHDSTPIKQEREAAKFDKALKVERHIDDIRAHIRDGLSSEKAQTRMIAAACYLIDRLSLRVGDEKDPEEADTVGATTLRAEHLIFKKASIIFDFLGKDSVPWHKEIQPNPDVYRVLKELHDNALERISSFKAKKSKKTKANPKKIAQIFPSIGSTHVNRFLSEVYPGLTAKVFRTYHASTIMRDVLRKSKAKRTDPEFIKKEAFKRANLEVARVMNHTKQAPKGWSTTATRYQDRIKKAEKRVQKSRAQLKEKQLQSRRIKKKEADIRSKKQELITKRKATLETYKASVASWREKRDHAKIAWDNARDQKSRTRSSRRKGKTTKKERLESAQERIDRTKERLDSYETSLTTARERYQKSKESLEKMQSSFTKWKEASSKRITSAERTVEILKDRVNKAELAKQKIESDFALAKESRTWNLGTSLKSYIHPKVVYNWSQRVDFDWRDVYSKALQRKFEGWIEE